MQLKYVFLFVSLIFINACSSDKFKIDVSGINADVKINRFEQDLFSYKTDSVSVLIDFLKMQYPEFFELYAQQIIKLGSTDNSVFPTYLKRFLIDYRITLAKQHIDRVFPDVNFLEKQLSDAFCYYKYYFPDKKIPRFYTCLTGFNESIILADNFVAIALDKYLGTDCDLYSRLGIDNYKILKMTKEMILVDVVSTWLKSDYPYNDSIDNFATNMIYNGIIQYAVDAILPNYPKELKLAYKPDQLYWAENNEDKIWDYFKKNKLIYSSNKIDIAKYINDAPFTSAFSANSAPRTAVFIGRQIVGSYMDNHPDISLEGLLQKRDYIDILTNSKYNP